MKLNRISRKLIKPDTPTPENLKNYNISFLDQLLEPMMFGVVLFYDSKKPENNIQSQLEESLAEILVQFYPLAGRYIKSEHRIDCGDQGVELVEAEAPGVELADLIVKTEIDQLRDLFPEQYFRIDEASHDPLMSIQATRFPSGGVAVAICVSHRVFDGSSLGTFVAAWSSATNPDYKTVDLIAPPIPSFNFPYLLPRNESYSGLVPEQLNLEEKENIVVKRFVFDKEAITSASGKTKSRVRVVCAVIAKALIAVDRAKHGRSRDFIITQPINMRERTAAPQPKHSCGNLFLPSFTRRVAAAQASVIGAEELADVIGDSVRKSIADFAGMVSPGRDGRGVITNAFDSVKQLWDPELNVMLFTDWSKFGFYEADFGFGKPVWATMGPQKPFIAAAVLMSDRGGGGIEAWLHLSPNDMRCFEQDEEIKSLTTNYNVKLNST